jgi:hypothetical protein
MGLHICGVEVRGADDRGPYAEIANDGPVRVLLTRIELANYTAAREHVCVYVFPRLTDGSPIELQPGQSAYVFSGEGEGEPYEAGWLLYAGWTVPIWDSQGDVAYLRDTDGRVLDSMVVGQARRHRDGHERSGSAGTAAAGELEPSARSSEA